MKKTKRAAAALMCLLLLAGCADTKTETKEDSSALPAETSSSQKDTDQSADPGEAPAETGEYALIDAPVEFSAESGFYDDPVELTMTCGEGLEIHYTTDGSVPTLSSPVFKDRLTLLDPTDQPNVLSAQTGTSADGDYIPRGKVLKGNVIRAAAFDGEGGRGPVTGGTYFIGIDREERFGDVPVISLMTDMDNLFDYDTGIYVLGRTHEEWLAEDKKNGRLDGWQQKGNYSNRGREWERDVYVEYLCGDGTVGFEQDMGVRIMGAASRNSTQKSLRLIARKDYGEKSVEFEVIPGNQRSDGTGPVTEYKSFILRNGGNDCNFAKVRDPYLQSLDSDKSFETQQYAPCVAFIDGEYWGMYTLTEDYNDNYIENNYGIDNNNVVMIKCGEIEEGEEEDYELYSEMYSFITSSDMSSPENYAKAGEYLDIEGFADYCAFNIYINNEDSIFEGNNWRMWRVREPGGDLEQEDGRWRMMAYDVDYSSGIYSNGSSFNDNNITKALVPQKDLSGDSQPPSDIFRSLMDNPDFKGLMVNALCDLRNISFEKTSAVAELRSMSAIYKKLVPATYRRFGPDYADLSNGIRSLQTFIEGRYDVFMYSITDSLKPGGRADVTVTKEGGGTVIMNRTALDLTSDFSGKYYKDYPVTLTAQPESGKTFVRWEAEGCTLSSDTDPVTTVTFDGDCKVKAVFE